MPYEMNYLNPASFMPQNNFKADGMLGGMMWNRQDTDYRKLMEIQHFLQQIGAQEAAQKHQEFMSGAGLRERERVLKGETIEGQIPHAREAAGQVLQTQGREAQFKRETELSPEKKEAFFTDLRNKTADREWQNWQKELTLGAGLANQAIKIGQTQGEAAAIGWMQEQLGKAEKAGISLSEATFLDPKKWQALYQSGIESVEYMQKVGQIKAKGAEDQEEARIRGQYGVTAAQERASAAGSRGGNVNIPQRKVQLKKLISSGQGSAEEIQAAKDELLGYVMDDFEGRITRDPMLRSLAETASLGMGTRSTQAAKRYEELYNQRLEETLKRNGLSQDTGRGKETGLKQAVEAAGFKYEPDKYEYRVKDGKVQRKPK